ncbi:DUF4157 domain-containing protein [Streptomyces sp. NPDC006290]|uniref:eCIS core domain-containing protein n=1 Tax=Streptomyces sp. NPDC006290 TaxID=3156745 RepID=UPI0033AE818D
MTERATPTAAAFEPLAAKPCECGGQTPARRLVQRCPENGNPGCGCAADHAATRSSAGPLEADVRAEMEGLFGADFSRVRVHTDGAAAASARSLDARAWTRSPDVYFGAGHYAPHTAAGRRLLAHELTHVVQQQNGLSPEGGVEPDGSPAEREAESAATRVANGERVSVRTRTARTGLAREGGLAAFSCPKLISAPFDLVMGTDAENAIKADFIATPGIVPWMTPTSRVEMKRIPQGAFTPERAGGVGEESSDPRSPKPRRRRRTAPQVIDRQRQGAGPPDLAHRHGDRVQLAEIKPASVPFLVEGEAQLLKYVTRGNSPENRAWRRNQGLNAGQAFGVMTPLVYQPASQLRTPRGRMIEVGWCMPGVIGYRGLTAAETEIIACGALRDRGAVDRFLDKALSAAQHEVDTYVDKKVDQLVTERIRNATIRDALRMLAKYGRDQLKVLAEKFLPGGGLLVEHLSTDELIDLLAPVLERYADQGIQQEVRRQLLGLKTRFLNEVKQHVKDRLRTLIEQELNTLCAAAAATATISVAELLKRLSQDMGRVFGEVAVEVARQWAVELLKQAAVGFAEALALTIAVVLFIVFLPEILAALGAAAPEIAALASAAPAWVARLWPLLTAAAASVGPQLQPTFGH